MSYQALYRKWRPDEFDEVKGQEHIVRTLKNQIFAKRIGHAYLFCGTRGTGKTTVARLFAKTVNCDNPRNGSPCNECDSCRAINAQNSVNVIEVDAASNNGVDSIREIRDNVQYPPTQGKYKVYIIDEVHMLSPSAFPALLKTLEEPPEYVIFILATTESHRIPITIMSRCQRYDFHRISIDTISNRLTELMEREHIEAEERAIRYVAKAAEGSMRDALSLLDQCIAFHLGEKLLYEHVLEILGAVDMDVFSELYDTISCGDVSGMLNQVEKMVMEGRELRQMVKDFTWYLRNLLLVAEAPDIGDAMDVSKEQQKQLKNKIERELNKDSKEDLSLKLMRYIRICSDLSNRINFSSQKRIDVEIAFLKLCKPQMEGDSESLKLRIAELEERVNELAQNKGNAAAVNNEPANQDTSLEEQEEFLKQQREYLMSLEPQIWSDMKEVFLKLPLVRKRAIELGYKMCEAIMKAAKPNITKGGKCLVFVFDSGEHMIKYQQAILKEHIDILSQAFLEVCGRPVEFEIVEKHANEAVKATVQAKLIRTMIEEDLPEELK